MLAWITLTALIAVPLVLQLRGRGIVVLSGGVALLYAIAALATLLLSNAGASDGAIQDPYQLTLRWNVILMPAVVFTAIAVVFGGLIKWQAPLPPESPKNLFWVLHVAILAMPILTLLLLRAGIPRSYFDGSAGFSVFTSGSMVVMILIMISLVGFIAIAARAAVKRLRA